jgi:hypothetical protein
MIGKRLPLPKAPLYCSCYPYLECCLHPKQNAHANFCVFLKIGVSFEKDVSSFRTGLFQVLIQTPSQDKMTSTAIKGSSFQGAFLFVNHDANNLDARQNRQTVFTHVQSQYRKWNRKERTKALLASAKVPLGNLTQAQPANKAQHLARSDKDKELDAPLDDDPENIPERNLVLRTSSPVMLKGGSDPFDTHAIAVTPEVNELITFFRDMVIPNIYHTGPQGWKTSKTANSHWQSAVQGLGDEGGALGFLARYAHVAAITNKDKRWTTRAFRYTSQSTGVLRERLNDSTALAQKASPLSQQVYWQINMLWGTEILSRNFDAAIIHGRMLRTLLEKQATHKQLDTTFLRYVLYNDSHLIASYMVRSVFDYDHWIPEQYKVMAEMAAAEMPNFDDVHAEEIDASVESDFLQQIFITRREHFEVWKQRTTAAGISPLMYAWLATVNSIHQGQLIQHALDAMDMARKAENAGRLWAEVYLSLAALYWIRSIGGSMIIRGVDIYDSQRPILEKLRRALTSAQESQTKADEVKYENARLWALFIGAQAEQGWRRPGWFCDNLFLLGKETGFGLGTWASVQQVLKRFLYTDMLPPHGSNWYKITIGQITDNQT